MRHFRTKRFNLFLRCVQPKDNNSLLDVGGYPGFWVQYPQPVRLIDCLNIHSVNWEASKYPNHQINSSVGNGCALPFPDRSYDIVFSNSVIEHVGEWQDQAAFASEARRVGNAVWIQTPARECPIEPHYIAPFVHYLPKGLQKALLRWITPWGWLQRPTQRQIDDAVETTRLLTQSEFRQLFPDCEIIVERIFGIIPKSYIAFRRSTSNHS